jgi:hypothetical protein
LQQFINGKPTIDVTDDCESMRASSGVLALQLHVGGPSSFSSRIFGSRSFTYGAN